MGCHFEIASGKSKAVIGDKGAEIRQSILMRLIRVTHPDPCQPITFHDRVAVKRCRLGHRPMKIVNTLSIRPEPHPMLLALNGIYIGKASSGKDGVSKVRYRR